MSKKSKGELELKKYFYYLRDEHGLPRVTICLAEDENGVFSRGIALCSLEQGKLKKEPPLNKKMGNNIAAGRAEKAFKTESTCCPTWRDEAYEVLESVRATGLPSLMDSEPPDYAVPCKAVYGLSIDSLTPYERELIANGGKRK